MSSLLLLLLLLLPSLPTDLYAYTDTLDPSLDLKTCIASKESTIKLIFRPEKTRRKEVEAKEGAEQLRRSIRADEARSLGRSASVSPESWRRGGTGKVEGMKEGAN